MQKSLIWEQEQLRPLKAIIDDEGYQSDERNVRVSDQYSIYSMQEA